MKKIVIYISLFISISCKNVINKENNHSANIQKTEYSEESFVSFFNKFKKDSLFQSEHYSEIIIFYEYDENDELVKTEKFRKEIQFIDFTKDSISFDLEENAYKVEITQLKDSVDYHLWGIDNGIDVSFIFKKKDSTWFLNAIYDFSN